MKEDFARRNVDHWQIYVSFLVFTLTYINILVSLLMLICAYGWSIFTTMKLTLEKLTQENMTKQVMSFIKKLQHY